MLNTTAVFDPDGGLQAGFNKLFKHLSIFLFLFHGHIAIRKKKKEMNIKSQKEANCMKRKNKLKGNKS